jgi:ABC-type nitrate/sulfonate/bicarbonate transport system substrate-binding protein
MSHRSVRRSAALVLSISLLAACGNGDDAGDSGGGEAGGQQDAGPFTITVANTSPVLPTYVATKYGVLTYGDEFNLDMTEEDFLTFDSHSVAAQSVLSGEADVVAGSFVSTLLLVAQGQKMQAFCPYIAQDDFVIAGANGVDSVDELFDPNVRVAIDSPGGAGSVIFDAMLQALGEERTTADMPGQQILESSGLRTSAYAAGEVDATVIHEPQYAEAAPQVEDPVIIASLWEEVPEYLKEVQAAPQAWLEENVEAAAGYCAATLKGMRELQDDVDAFITAAQEYTETDKGLDEETLRETHELINEYGFWPAEDGGLGEEKVAFMADVAVKSGLLDEAPAYEDVVNRKVLDRALELLDE